MSKTLPGDAPQSAGSVSSLFRKPAEEWTADDALRPADVAAAFVAQRIVAHLRSARRDLSIRMLMKELDVSKAVAERWLGTGNMNLAEVVLLASHFGDAILDAIPRSQIDLLPATFHKLLADWTPGTPLKFSSLPSPESPSWNRAATAMASWVSQEAQEGRLRLLREWDFALPLVVAAQAAGFAPLSFERPTAQEPVLEIVARETLTVTARYIPDDDTGPREAQRRLTAAFKSPRPSKHAVHVLVLGSVARGQWLDMIHPRQPLVVGATGLLELSEGDVSDTTSVRVLALCSIGSELNVVIFDASS